MDLRSGSELVSTEVSTVVSAALVVIDEWARRG